MRSVVGFGEVSRETAIVGDGQFALEEDCRDIVSHELEVVAESAVDGGGENSVEGEEVEVVISCGGVGDLGVSGGRSSFHSSETDSHSLEAVVWEELELEEHEEPEEDCVWWNVGLVDECKALV